MHFLLYSSQYFRDASNPQPRALPHTCKSQKHVFFPPFPQLPEMGISHEPAKAAKADTPARKEQAAAADPGQGEQLQRCPSTTGSGCILAGGSRRCRARRQMGNLASSEMLLRPAGSVESCPSCCHPGAAGREMPWWGDIPHAVPGQPRDQRLGVSGLRAANAAMVEVTCRGTKAGNLGFPLQKNTYLGHFQASPAPCPRVDWGWHGVAPHQGSDVGLRGTQSHSMSLSLLCC